MAQDNREHGGEVEAQILITGEPELVQKPDPSGLGGVWNVEARIGGVTQHISVTGEWLELRGIDK